MVATGSLAVPVLRYSFGIINWHQEEIQNMDRETIYSFLRMLFSNTLSLCSSLNVRDQLSHPHKTTGRIMVLCILIFTAGGKTKDSGPNGSKHSPNLFCS
jgi:hypothetical protein